MPGISYYSIVHEKNKQVQAAFTLFFSKRKGLEQISNPPFFQNCSLVVKNNKQNSYERQSVTKRVLKCFSSFLSEFSWVNISLPHSFNDAQPFIWDGFTVSPRYTYLLDISNSNKELLTHFSKGLKNDLSKISKSEVKYKTGITEEVINFLYETSAKERAESEQLIWSELMKISGADEQTMVTAAHYSNFRGVACIITVGSNAIYMFGNSDKDSPLALNSAALLKAIDVLRSNRVSTLDFEGSMIPGIERYFRSFGGQLTPYYNIIKEPKLIRTAKFLKG